MLNLLVEFNLSYWLIHHRRCQRRQIKRLVCPITTTTKKRWTLTKLCCVIVVAKALIDWANQDAHFSQYYLGLLDGFPPPLWTFQVNEGERRYGLKMLQIKCSSLGTSVLFRCIKDHWPDLHLTPSWDFFCLSFNVLFKASILHFQSPTQTGKARSRWCWLPRGN